MGTELILCIVFWALSWLILGGHMLLDEAIDGWWRPIWVGVIIAHFVMCIHITDEPFVLNNFNTGDSNSFLVQVFLAVFLWAGMQIATVIAIIFILWFVKLVKWTCNLI